jgi:hypothetical protein
MKNPLLISQWLHVWWPVLGAKDQCSMEKNRTGGEKLRCTKNQFRSDMELKVS